MSNIDLCPDELRRLLTTRRGKKLEYFTLAWNLAEGLVGVIAGLIAGSVVLTGFGIDSLIEVTSGSALLWRMSVDADPTRRARAEKTTLRIVGACFLGLAAYVAVSAILSLWHHSSAEKSPVGIALAIAALVVMPLLARAKRKVASELGSRAMAADAKQSGFCGYLAAILLGGLMLNILFGWWWADPVAALIMAPFIVYEGTERMRGGRCCD